jgi:hypothetical protein
MKDSEDSDPQQPQPSKQQQQQSIFEMILSEDKPRTFQQYSHQQALHRPVPKQDDSEYSLDTITRQSLPFFLPWTPNAAPKELPPDFSWLSNCKYRVLYCTASQDQSFSLLTILNNFTACGGKAAIGVFGGGVMGLLMGVFLGAMSDATPPITVIAGKDVPTAPFREQMRVVMKATGQKSLYW